MPLPLGTAARVPLDGLRAAVVGSGLIARKKVDLVATCDLDREAARDADRQFDVPSVFAEVDIVDVCTPPATHAAIVGRALKSGSHVLVEKPMGSR